jgi:hypothetical protein
MDSTPRYKETSTLKSWNKLVHLDSPKAPVLLESHCLRMEFFCDGGGSGGMVSRLYTQLKVIIARDIRLRHIKAQIHLY